MYIVYREPRSGCNPISNSEDACPSSAHIEEPLGPNEPLLPAEKKCLHILVRKSESALTLLDPRMSHARKAFNSLLLSAKEKEEEIVETANIILHRMRSICNELLLEFFSCYVYDISDSTGVGESLDSFNLCHAPWTISPVIRRWRIIALASSRLL
ncbi:hypothetical protein IW262DRAFT_1087125 [Armillaria fumosa]|nr:hypothetical protein IW262DRAFT_1087125 [Armillaria fumosa]